MPCPYNGLCGIDISTKSRVPRLAPIKLGIRMRRAYIKKILIEHGIRPSKRLGQSFLTSESIAERIVDSGGIHSEDQVLEIGAGLGILTERIAEKAKQVLSVEIDPRLFMILKERFLNDKRIVLLKGDILKLNLKEISQEWGGRIKVMGNLPYSITKPLLRKLLENFQSVESTVVTVQEEVARRICGNPRQSKK